LPELAGVGRIKVAEDGDDPVHITKFQDIRKDHFEGPGVLLLGGRGKEVVLLRVFFLKMVFW
jgi:hypothetical protein